jgi:hypothetical protein
MKRVGVSGCRGVGVRKMGEGRGEREEGTGKSGRKVVGKECGRNFHGLEEEFHEAGET